MAKKLKLSAEEKAAVVTAARLAAVSMAGFWDALREIETAHNVEFDGTAELIGELAGNCNCPASTDDISVEDVLDGVMELRV